MEPEVRLSCFSNCIHKSWHGTRGALELFQGVVHSDTQSVLKVVVLVVVLTNTQAWQCQTRAGWRTAEGKNSCRSAGSPTEAVFFGTKTQSPAGNFCILSCFSFKFPVFLWHRRSNLSRYSYAYSVLTKHNHTFFISFFFISWIFFSSAEFFLFSWNRFFFPRKLADPRRVFHPGQEMLKCQKFEQLPPCK